MDFNINNGFLCLFICFSLFHEIGLNSSTHDPFVLRIHFTILCFNASHLYISFILGNFCICMLCILYACTSILSIKLSSSI